MNPRSASEEPAVIAICGIRPVNLYSCRSSTWAFVGRRKGEEGHDRRRVQKVSRLAAWTTGRGSSRRSPSSCDRAICRPRGEVPESQGPGVEVQIAPPQLSAHARHARARQDWSLTSLKEKLIKIGAKVVSHGRYVAFQMAEGRHSEKPVCRHPAVDWGIAAAARYIDWVMRSVVTRSTKKHGRRAS